MDVMDLRRRIMLNEPRIVTPASAGLQTFRTDLVAPLKECKVHFSPAQEGTGDPSPDNVRPISGWTGLEVYSDTISPSKRTTIPIDWTTEAGTVYGGYLDLVSGEVVQEFYSIPPSSWQFIRQNNGFKAYFSHSHPTTILGGAWYCNKVKEYGSFNSSNMNKNIIQKCSTTIGALGSIFLSLDENVDVSTIQVVYIINLPIRHPINPVILKTLRGMNNVWSNANGNIDISYWAH